MLKITAPWLQCSGTARAASGTLAWNNQNQSWVSALPPPVVQSGKKLLVVGLSTDINGIANEVGTQSISPLLWAISSGNLEAR